MAGFRMLDGIIVGAAAAAIGAIVANKVLNKGPVGGDTPAQAGTTATTPGVNAQAGSNPQFGRPLPLAVIDTVPTPSTAAPLVQVNPITEAAYNQNAGPSTMYEPAFHTNFASHEEVLPI